MLRFLFSLGSSILLSHLAQAQPARSTSPGTVTVVATRITTPLLKRVISVDCDTSTSAPGTNITVEIETEFEKNSRGAWSASPRGSAAKLKVMAGPALLIDFQSIESVESIKVSIPDGTIALIGERNVFGSPQGLSLSNFGFAHVLLFPSTLKKGAFKAACQAQLTFGSLLNPDNSTSLTRHTLTAADPSTTPDQMSVSAAVHWVHDNRDGTTRIISRIPAYENASEQPVPITVTKELTDYVKKLK